MLEFGRLIVRAASLNPHYHVRRFDDGLDLPTNMQAEFLHQLVGDRSRDRQALHVDEHMSRGRAFLYLLDRAFENIAGGNLHDFTPKPTLLAPMPSDILVANYYRPLRQYA